MPVEKELRILTKAVAYDLLELFEAGPGKECYTPEEIKAIIKTYAKESTK